MDLLGFWSYVHADDDVDMGRITQLARDIVGHYEAIKAEKIELFLDADNLHWGDAWRDRVDETLANVAFFIPVLTPRFFKSVECRREFEFFANKASALGIRELILPILYIEVPELLEDSPTDNLMQTVKDIQWEPWTSYRFSDRTSGEYRAAVDKLARELVRRVGVVESADVVAAVQASEDPDVMADGEAGMIDRIAALEEAMPRWTSTLNEITNEISRIGAIMTEGTQAMNQGDKQGKAFAARLTVARRVANELGGPVEKIESLGQTFAADLSDIDAGVRTLIEYGQVEAKKGGAQEAAQFCEFLDTIRSVGNASRNGLGSIEGMIVASEPIEKMSKDMRGPMRRLRNSLTSMLQARDTTDAWVELADSVDIDCSGTVRALPSEPTPQGSPTD